MLTILQNAGGLWKLICKQGGKMCMKKYVMFICAIVGGLLAVGTVIYRVFGEPELVRDFTE